MEVGLFFFCNCGFLEIQSAVRHRIWVEELNVENIRPVRDGMILLTGLLPKFNPLRDFFLTISVSSDYSGYHALSDCNRLAHKNVLRAFVTNIQSRRDCMFIESRIM